MLNNFLSDNTYSFLSRTLNFNSWRKVCRPMPSLSGFCFYSWFQGSFSTIFEHVVSLQSLFSIVFSISSVFIGSCTIIR